MIAAIEKTLMVNLTTQIDSSSVFLVSGGARGITAQCILKLAQQYPCQWILLGRSSIAAPLPVWATDCFDEDELKRRIMAAMREDGEKPTPVKVQKQLAAISARRDIETTLQALAQLGRRATYLSVDVTDLAALQQQLATVLEQFEPVTGIVHGAGNLADKLIENKTEQDFEYVYTAKVKGLENLLACVSVAQLKQVVLFSSVAGFYGSAGQSDYAIANEILNKSALRLKRLYPGCHVVSINWGPWDSGMVTPALKQAFADRNIEIIPIEVGTSLFVDELADQHQNIAQVVIGSALVPQGRDLDSDLRAHRIRRRLTLEANPFLQDHVIGGYPVLPATCAAAWMINTCERLYPGYRFFSLENFKVLKGIVFDQTQPVEFIVDLQEAAKVNSEAIVFDVRVWSEATKKIRFHYSGQVILRRQIPPVPTHHLFETEPVNGIPGQSLYQDKTLFHGPSFQGVQQVLGIHPEHLTMRCSLPDISERAQGQFPVQTFNPYAADVMIQSILIWLRQLHQTAALPLEIQQIVQFKPIPLNQPFYTLMELHKKTETDVTANITAYDDQTQIYAYLAGVKMTISERLNTLFERSPIAASTQ